MRQQSLLSTVPPPVADDPTVARDLFGNPITPTGPAAPTYRPRKPVQQALTFAPAFTLGSK